MITSENSDHQIDFVVTIIILIIIIIIITLFMSQMYLAEQRGSTNWGHRKSNQHKSNQMLVFGESRAKPEKLGKKPLGAE